MVNLGIRGVFLMNYSNFLGVNFFLYSSLPLLFAVCSQKSSYTKNLLCFACNFITEYPGTTSFRLRKKYFVLFCLHWRPILLIIALYRLSVRVQQTQNNAVLSSLLCVWQCLSFRKLSAVGDPGNLQPKSDRMGYLYSDKKKLPFKCFCCFSATLQK